MTRFGAMESAGRGGDAWSQSADDTFPGSQCVLLTGSPRAQDPAGEQGDEEEEEDVLCLEKSPPPPPPGPHSLPAPFFRTLLLCFLQPSRRAVPRRLLSSSLLSSLSLLPSPLRAPLRKEEEKKSGRYDDTSDLFTFSSFFCVVVTSPKFLPTVFCTKYSGL